MAASITTKKRGYQKLASFMDSHEEVAIFRRFTRLNLLNLMSLQAELMELEEDLNIAWEADEKDPERKIYSVDFNALRKSRLKGPPTSDGKSGDERSEPQWQTLIDIRTKLKEYNDTLLQVAEVRGLQAPEPEDVSTLRDWLERTDYGGSEIVDLEGKAWAAPNDIDAHEDLVSLQPNTSNKAPFSSWATGRLLTLFHEKIGYRLKISHKRDEEAGPDISNYEETKLERNIRFLVTVIASLLPVVCIVVLNALKSVGLRLGITAVFTAAFAAVLVIFTTAKEVEIFASTAAFAAVEVVFIGSALNSRGGNSSAT